MASKALQEALQVAIERQALYEADERNRIEIPSDLTDPLPPVRRTSTTLLSQKPSHTGPVSSDAPGTLAVCCSPASIDRATRIMAALIQAAELRGWPLAEPRAPKGETKIVIGPEVVSLRLEEKLKTIWRSATPEERSQMRRRRQIVTPTNERVLSGKLALEVVDGATYGLRRSWGDAKVQRLENILNKVMLGLFTIAERRRVERLERERFEERCRRWRERKAEKRRRIEKLETDAAAWDKAVRIRAYLDAFRAHVSSRDGIDDATQEWIEWAAAYADEIDPLTGRGLPSLIDASVPANDWPGPADGIGDPWRD